MTIVAFAGALAFGSAAQNATAAQDPVASVIATPKAPVALTHCSSHIELIGMPSASDNAINRSDVFLSSYVVRWFLYDHSGNAMGQQDLPYSFSTDLAPGDTTTNSTILSYYTEPLSALDHLTCRLESARFEGGLSWTYGRVWHRRLAPLPRPESFNNSPSSSAASESDTAQVSNLGNVSMTVVNAWNDMTNGNMLVHVALYVKTATRDALLRPKNLYLTMKLANGEDQVFTAMTEPAPTYQKLDPLGQTSTTQTAFEVDPKDDLGRLGAVNIPANCTAHFVATFAIGNTSVLNPRDNARVVLR